MSVSNQGLASRADTNAWQPASSQALAAILEAGVNAVIIERDANPAMELELAALQPAALAMSRDPLEPANARQVLGGRLAQAGYDPQAFPLWLDDMVALVAWFQALLPLRTINARLEGVTGDGCRRFHVDRNRLRLLCTYRGATTRWVEDCDVERAALYACEPNERVVPGGREHAVPERAVLVMKGEAWPGNGGRGCVHRSPPASLSSAGRILLALDF